MTKRTFFFLFGTLLFSSLLWYSQADDLHTDPSCGPEPPTFAGPDPTDWMYRQRAYPHGLIRKEVYLEASRQWQTLQNARSGQEPAWRSMGPMAVGGRITSLAVHPTNRSNVFVGAASGGIFKTLDGGQTWRPVFDREITLSIGDLAIAPSRPSTIYAGTGEANAGGGSLAYDGAGVYKSTDNGETWISVGLENTGSIGKVIVHPQQPNTVYVATMGSLFANNPQRGLYRSPNGGQSWEQILYLSDSTGVIDLAIHPDQPEILFAASWERIRRPNRRQYGGLTSGIHKSTDGGNTWKKLSLPIDPNQSVGRIGLTISPANPNRLYASVVDGDTDLLQGIYRTDNLGQSWTSLTLTGINQVPFMWWFGKIYADPIDADLVYLCGLHMHRYREGDNRWERIMAGVHVDQHALYIEPMNRDFILVGNDGGLYRGTNDLIDSWTHFENLPITQFYTSEIDFQEPARLFGGTQDNGSLRRDPNSGQWEHILGGDGFVNLVDPTDSRYVYAESQYGNFRRSTTGGDLFYPGTPIESLSENRNWNTPVILDPNDPATLYYGAQRVFRSRDRAQSWEAISPILVSTPPGSNLLYGSLTSLAVSPADSDVIYAGADDGSLFVTTDGGEQWTPVHHELPRRWITRISIHPSDPAVAYVTFSGYRWNEYLPHVYRTANRGASWHAVAAGLPEVPVNDLVINPDDPQQLFLATDAGVFWSADEGQHWQPLGADLPGVVVNDLTYHPPTQTLVAATYGRSMYQLKLDQLPLASAATLSGLRQFRAFPNPFQEQTQIEIELEQSDRVELSFYDLQGRQVASLTPGRLPAGAHRFTFSAPAPGSYLCRIRTTRGNRGLLLLRQ